MGKAFEVLRRGADPGQPIPKRDAANAELLSRLPQSDVGYQYKRREEDAWRLAPGKPALKSALADMNLKTGGAIYARKTGRRVFVLRAVEYTRPDPIAPCPDTNATPSVKALWTAVNEATAEVEREIGVDLELVFMGIYNCRRIDGSSKWSQHAFRNALDFRIRRANADSSSIDQDATSRVVHKVREKASQTLWLVPGHTYHCHLSGDPLRSGTPACAG